MNAIDTTDIKPDAGANATPPKMLGLISSLPEYVSNLHSLAQEGEILWYRGVGKSNSHSLSPTLYRIDGVDGDSLLKREKDLLTQFRHRSPPFIDSNFRNLEDELELMFLMQHHGAPTRLLDWTENPFVALYFALQKYRKRPPEENPVVWVLRPKRLNNLSLTGIARGRDEILLPGHANLKPYVGQVTRERPVSLFGTHNGRRIVAQRGVFVLFGTDTKPMDQDESIYDGVVMSKIEFKRDSVSDLFKSLTSMGITDSVIFPDLDGLAKEVGYQNGY